MASHSGILVWEIPWTEEPGSYSPWVAKLDATEHARTITRHWASLTSAWCSDLAV